MTQEDFERAIKVLQKHNQDLIAEIQMLKKEMCDKCKYFDGNSCQHYDYKVGYTHGYEDASKKYRQEPKTGRWIAYEVRLPDRTILNYRCSVCGRKLIGYNTETLSEAPFCHCGAKMFEPQESEKVNCESTKCENCQNHNYCDYEPK